MALCGCQRSCGGSDQAFLVRVVSTAGVDCVRLQLQSVEGGVAQLQDIEVAVRPHRGEPGELRAAVFRGSTLGSKVYVLATGRRGKCESKVVASTQQVVAEFLENEIPDCSTGRGCVSLELPVTGIDADGDGYEVGVDCDDSDPSRNPGAPEQCGGPVDMNCDGLVGCNDPSCVGKACDATGGACCPGQCKHQTDCRPGAPDENCDGLVGCADPGCQGKICDANQKKCAAGACVCPGGSIESSCSDGMDNNCDGLVDCADTVGCPAGTICGGGKGACVNISGIPDCCQRANPAPSEVGLCADGVDNDCDGLTDCADVADCPDKVACKGAGNICCAAACHSASTEFGGPTDCYDGKDNNCDGKVDGQDPSCNGKPCDGTGATWCGAGTGSPVCARETNCADGLDNDCDGLTDCQDSDCLGRACNDGSACTTGESCLAGGICGAPKTTVICTAADQCHDIGTCQPTGPIAGTCTNPQKLNNTLCNDNNLCTRNDVCTNGVCAGTLFTCAATVCQASSTCNGSGCAVTNSPNGIACGSNQVCFSGACQSGCYIAGTFYASGAANPGNACQSCQPASSISAWTSRTDGSSCGAGQVCVTSLCRAGCFIGGAYYAAGALDPANTCRSCQPSLSTSAWNTLTNGTACNDGNSCTRGDRCLTGVCTPVFTETCTACGLASGTCDPLTGLCGGTGTPAPGGSCCAAQAGWACDGAGSCTQDVSKVAEICNDNLDNNCNGQIDCAEPSCNGAICFGSATSICCGTACVDIAASNANCGGCGMVCTGGATCNGQGVCTGCASGNDCPKPAGGTRQTCVASTCICGFGAITCPPEVPACSFGTCVCTTGGCGGTIPTCSTATAPTFCHR